MPAEQLTLAIPNEPSGTVGGDPVDSVLSAYDGNARLVIRELLADADFLRGQLYTAYHLMSKGMGRGWRPCYERV